MSGASNRNWAEMFTPPPPPPLGRAAVPQDAQTSAEAPAEEPSAAGEALPEPSPGSSSAEATSQGSGASASTAQRHLRPADQGDTVGASAAVRELRAAPADAPTELSQAPASAPAAEVAVAEVRGTPSELEQASAIVAALRGIGVNATFEGVRRADGVRGFDLRVAPGDLEVARRHELELVDALAVEAIGLDATPDETVIHVEVVPRTTNGKAKQLAVWLPADVRDATNHERSAADESFTEFFLGAFNRQYSALGGLFAGRLPTAGPMPMKTTRRRRGIDTAVQSWLYLNDEQRQVLDETVELYAAGSRSALVTKILQADLGLLSGSRPTL